MNLKISLNTICLKVEIFGRRRIIAQKIRIIEIIRIVKIFDDVLWQTLHSDLWQYLKPPNSWWIDPVCEAAE